MTRRRDRHSVREFETWNQSIDFFFRCCSTMATPRSSTDLTADADEQSGQSEEMPPPPPPVDPSPAAHQVSAVSVKLPPFWPTDPQLWFAQVEAQFRTRSITREETKFWHVVGTLEQKYANEVRDLLLEPPASNPYTVLKTQLVARLTQRVRTSEFDSCSLTSRSVTGSPPSFCVTCSTCRATRGLTSQF